MGGSLVLIPSPASPPCAVRVATGATGAQGGEVGEGVGRIEGFKYP